MMQPIFQPHHNDQQRFALKVIQDMVRQKLAAMQSSALFLRRINNSFSKDPLRLKRIVHTRMKTSLLRNYTEYKKLHSLNSIKKGAQAYSLQYLEIYIFKNIYLMPTSNGTITVLRKLIKF